MTDALTCAEPGCDRPVHARGLCNAHYQWHLRRGFALCAAYEVPTQDATGCGEGTPYGCKLEVYGPMHVVLGIAPPHQGHKGMRVFHAERCCPCPSCLDLIEVIPNAFSRRLAREQAARLARAAS